MFFSFVSLNYDSETGSWASADMLYLIDEWQSENQYYSIPILKKEFPLAEYPSGTKTIACGFFLSAKTEPAVCII
jgi:hypothetical protein